MSNDEHGAPAREQEVPAVTEDRLAVRIRVSEKMRPFMGRMRLRLEHLDLADPEAVDRLDSAKQRMRQILRKKNVPVAEAERAIQQALDAAVDYQIQALRAEQADQRNARSKEQLRRLMRHIALLSTTIAKLPRFSKGKLNRIVKEQIWTEFDSEAFGRLFQMLLDTVVRLSPRRYADDAGTAIRESLEYRDDPVVAFNTRQAPPALIELWEYIPDATRTAAEAHLRGWIPPTRGQVSAFLAYLNSLLKRHRPKRDRRRRRALVGVYLNKIGAIWERLALDIALARGGSREKKAESLIHQFAKLALAGIGDNSVVSLRQIANLKRDRAVKVQ
jgi:hypothetical protein